MKKEQNEQFFELKEEPGVTVFDFFSVLFGRKILLAIITAALFISSAIGIVVFNRGASTYEATYSYSASGLAEGKYIDGSRFDARDLISLDKFKKYGEENDELKELNMEKIYREGVVQSFEHEITYKANENKKTEEDPSQIVDKDNYKIVLKKSLLTMSQAQALTKAIAEEVNKVSQQIVDNADYNQYLEFYNTYPVFDYQVDYLEAQYELLDEKFANLIAEYGDVFVNSSKKISDIQLQMEVYFTTNSFESLKSELNYNGYVKNDESYSMELKEQINALTREKNLDISKKDDLSAQRDALLNAASTGSLNTVELTAYNEEIIKLSNQIHDTEEEISILNSKLSNIGKEETDPVYAEKLHQFEAKLQKYYEKLTDMTNDYSTYERSVVRKYSTVYYEHNSVVIVKSAFSTIVALTIALGASFVVALLVNLFIDGKKLTTEYRVAHYLKESQKEDN